MIDGEILQHIESIARSLERLADKFAPEESRTRRAAVLSTATYSREEREREELRKYLKTKGPKVRAVAAVRPDDGPA